MKRWRLIEYHSAAAGGTRWLIERRRFFWWVDAHPDRGSFETLKEGQEEFMLCIANNGTWRIIASQ